jgi:hypothetical protein
MSNRILNIRRVLKMPTFTLSTFSIGTVTGFFMEPPVRKKTGSRDSLPPGMYSLAWTSFSNPKYKINFNEPIPLLFNNKNPVARLHLIGHGNRSVDLIDNSMLTGVWYKEDKLIGSVKALKKLTAYLHEVGIQNVTVIIH